MENYANEPIVDRKYGYTTRKKMAQKQIFGNFNGISTALVFFFISSFGFSLLLGITNAIFYELGFGFTFTDEFTYAVSSLLTFSGLLLPFLIYNKFAKIKSGEILRFEKTDMFAPMYVFAATGIGLMANIPINIISAILEENGINLGGSDVEIPQSDAGVILMFFAVAIVAPLCEEYIFRGIILTKLRKHGDVFAIVTSSILFGLAHQNFVSIPVTFAICCVMGYVYVKTNNLWVPISVHFLNNFISVTLSVVIDRVTDENLATILTTSIFYGFIILGIICTIIILVLNKNKTKMQNELAFISSGAKFKSFISSPTTIIYTLACIASAVMIAIGIE